MPPPRPNAGSDGRLKISPFSPICACCIIQDSTKTRILSARRRDADSPERAAAMPKQKTHKGTRKRFRLSAKGKIKHRPAGTSHLASRKDQKRIRKLRGTETLGAGMEKAIKRALAGNSY
jgi:large subunit ribosomal protein L35